MPRWVYTDSEGNEHEYVCRWEDRPESFTLPDGREVHFDFRATALTQSGPRPACDHTLDEMTLAVHPNQSDEYNRTARAIGISGSDAQWDEHGYLHATRTGKKQLASAMEKARGRAADPEFKPDTTAKRIKT